MAVPVYRVRVRLPAGCTGLDGENEAEFSAPASQPLLVSAEAAGLAWPSSCRNGTCRTCIGRAVAGQVEYQIAWPGLSAEEKKSGHILPCVAYPASDLLIEPVLT